MTPIVVGNQLWGCCPDCEKFIRMNKPVFGSLHICLTPEEITAKRNGAIYYNGEPKYKLT